MAAIEKRQGAKGIRYRAKVLVRYNPETGKTRFMSRTFGKLAEAEQWAKEQEVARGKGELVEPTKEIFATYARRFLDDVLQGRIRARTYQGYSSILRRYIEDPPKGCPPIGDIRLDRLTTEAIQGFYGWLQRVRGLAPGTIRSIHAILRQVLDYGERTGAVGRNVANLVILPKRQKKEVEAMSLDELRRFLSAAESDRYHPLWVLLPSTGLRPGEALGLKWQDLDLESGKLRVQRTLSRVIGREWKLTLPKTNRSRRMILLSESTVAVLRQWKRKQARARLKAGSEWTDHGFVFSTGTGEPLDWSNVRRNFERVMAEAGIGEWGPEPRKPRSGPMPNRKFIPKYRSYALRHTHASLLLRQGVNPKVISERLGHFSVGFTLDTYTDSLEDMQEEAAMEMEAILQVAEG